MILPPLRKGGKQPPHGQRAEGWDLVLVRQAFKGVRRAFGFTAQALSLWR